MTAVLMLDRETYNRLFRPRDATPTAAQKEAEARQHEDRKFMYEAGAIFAGGLALAANSDPRLRAIKAAAEATAVAAAALALGEEQAARAAADEARKLREQEQQRAAEQQRAREEAQRMESDLRQKGDAMMERWRRGDVSDFVDTPPPRGHRDDDGTMYA